MAYIGQRAGFEVVRLRKLLHTAKLPSGCAKQYIPIYPKEGTEVTKMYTRGLTQRVQVPNN